MSCVKIGRMRKLRVIDISRTDAQSGPPAEHQVNIVRRSQISGSFEGFDDETLFKLTDGTFWLQDEYKYWYHYAYCPKAVILQEGGALYIQVDNQDQVVRVRQVYDVVEGTIDGEFTGWSGDSQYKLTNGQTWKQAAYKYEYKYVYRPEVTIYTASSGTIMDVDGAKAQVRRVR